MGGFNSPIEGTSEGVNALISSNLYESLKKNDMLYLQFRNYAEHKLDADDEEIYKGSPRRFEEDYPLEKYREGEVMFGPTSKIVPFSDTYNISSNKENQ